ncbi:unnamed protein product [Ambrosiozyma monospora]|uniref:Unnamed protein product n=1 Tax=Ambrosiozyma monospora TaxID=43982 RepID=A0A9W7DC46_AMBMO|nr:unnamed protein product [Ambrosiozyma monospora]
MVQLPKPALFSFRKALQFIGPGILVSCAYIDPGNYSTSTAAGAQFHNIHLFIILLSNIFAVILQCLCIKLGSVTGLDLAENCRKHLPRWLNLSLWTLAQFAIIFTDLAEVVGTAISLYILFGVPLKLGVFLTILDVLAILLFYDPDGSVRQVRKFEIFVCVFVFATFVSFALLIAKVDIPSVGGVFKGFLPSKELFQSKQSIFLALGIIGATVMPHSLYLGSNLVKPRLKEYDIAHELTGPNAHLNSVTADDDSSDSADEWTNRYKPSISAIKYCLNYSYWELILSLCIVAVFINSAILIVSGAALFGKPDAEDADLISIYEMLCQYVSKQAGLIFAWAMLFSSIAAGVICTMAGMLVAEGGLKWKLNPFVTRLITRTISIIPCLFMVLFLGREGIALMLNLSQVILSLILPFACAPLIYFTSNKEIMRVEITRREDLDEIDAVSEATETIEEESSIPGERTALLDRSKSSDDLGTIKYKDYSNSLAMNAAAITTWVTIGFLNIYLIVQFLRGEDVHF